MRLQLDLLDADEFAALRRIIVMATLMGAESVLAGLQPGVAAALIEAGADVDGLNAASNPDAAFALLQPAPELPEEEEPATDAEAEDAPAPETEQQPGAER